MWCEKWTEVVLWILYQCWRAQDRSILILKSNWVCLKFICSLSIQMLAYWRDSICSRMGALWKRQHRGYLLIQQEGSWHYHRPIIFDGDCYKQPTYPGLLLHKPTPVMFPSRGGLGCAWLVSLRGSPCCFGHSFATNLNLLCNLLNLSPQKSGDRTKKKKVRSWATPERREHKFLPSF